MGRVDDVDPAIDAIERAIEHLLRLNANRKVHARQAEAAGVSISPPGLSLLRRLQDEGPLSLGDLARRAAMDPAVTGRQVRQLEEAGYVRRAPDPADGRVTLVKATPKGAEVRRRLASVTGRHMEDVLGGWSARDRAALARLLPRLVDDLRSVHYRPAAEL